MRKPVFLFLMFSAAILNGQCNVHDLDGLLPMYLSYCKNEIYNVPDIQAMEEIEPGIYGNCYGDVATTTDGPYQSYREIFQIGRKESFSYLTFDKAHYDKVVAQIKKTSVPIGDYFFSGATFAFYKKDNYYIGTTTLPLPYSDRESIPMYALEWHHIIPKEYRAGSSIAPLAATSADCRPLSLADMHALLVHPKPELMGYTYSFTQEEPMLVVGGGPAKKVAYYTKCSTADAPFDYYKSNRQVVSLNSVGAVSQTFQDKVFFEETYRTILADPSYKKKYHDGDIEQKNRMIYPDKVVFFEVVASAEFAYLFEIVRRVGHDGAAYMSYDIAVEKAQ